MPLLDKFPGIPREEQKYVLNAIDEAFASGKKFIIIQAPTGSGKSHMGATLALSTSFPKEADIICKGHPQVYKRFDPLKFEQSGAYVLTTTKQLQDQYDVLFKDSSILKGKDNYICDIDPLSDVTTAPCMYKSNQMGICSRCGGCAYVEDYKSAMSNRFTALNYNMYFSLPDAFKKKEILICDEASEFEDQVISFYSLTLKYKMLDTLKIEYNILKTDDTQTGYLWICDLLAQVKAQMPHMKEGMTQFEVNKYKIFKRLAEKLTLMMNEWNTSEFIIELVGGGVNMSPMRANKLARGLISPADKVVFMSATIINPTIMARSIGLSPNDYTFIDVDSHFDPKKSPIYLSPAIYDMRYKNINAELPKMVKDVLKLCEIHKEDNGIIHTNSFKINNAFKAAVKGNPRFLVREEGVSNEVLLCEHYERNDPTVLISPSLAFGTSLDDKHGRFQVITKIPYLPLTDKRIKVAANSNFEWYQMKMWIKLVQMCGRCTRSKSDHSMTYIFDKSFLSALGRYRNKLPKWFMNRLV